MTLSKFLMVPGDCMSTVKGPISKFTALYLQSIRSLYPNFYSILSDRYPYIKIERDNTTLLYDPHYFYSPKYSLNFFRGKRNITTSLIGLHYASKPPNRVSNDIFKTVPITLPSLKNNSVVLPGDETKNELLFLFTFQELNTPAFTLPIPRGFLNLISIHDLIQIQKNPDHTSEVAITFVDTPENISRITSMEAIVKPVLPGRNLLPSRTFAYGIIPSQFGNAVMAWRSSVS